MRLHPGLCSREFTHTDLRVFAPRKKIYNQPDFLKFVPPVCIRPHRAFLFIFPARHLVQGRVVYVRVPFIDVQIVFGFSLL